MAKIDYGPRAPKGPKPEKAGINADQYRKIFGGGTDFKAGSHLIYSRAEKVDYQNCLVLTMALERHTDDSILLEYRYAIPFPDMEKAEAIVMRLRRAADDIEKNCVDKVHGKEKPF